MSISLDDRSLELLALQRPSYRKMTTASAALRFQQEIDAFLAQSPWLSKLPAGTNRVLDIGAGIGFGTCALWQHLQDRGDFYVLDKSEVPQPDKVYYGFETQACAYNELEVTRRFLANAGIPADRLKICDANRDGFPTGVVFDLVMAHISWGFHFPVSTYLSEVTASTRPGSLLYLDIRKDTDGIERLSKDFEMIWSRPGSKAASTAWRRKLV